MTKKQKRIILVLRVIFGGLFLYSGLDKLINDFSAAGFLLNATSGPFTEIYASMAGNLYIDYLVIYGEILVGLALVIGGLVRLASYMGALMMLLFYLAVLPPEHGFISEHIIYILVFATLSVFGAGRYLGIDKYIENSKLLENKQYLKYILG